MVYIGKTPGEIAHTMSLDYLDDWPEGKVGCPVTGRLDMIDDCYVTIEFGYGSDKDMTTYNLGPVHDSVGKKVLDAIQSMLPAGKSVEEFGKDVMEEELGGKS